jgi:amino acid adenylation domain-containing protein
MNNSEQHQILIEWNATEVDYAKNKSISQIFEEQVEQNPKAVAAILPCLGHKSDKQLTYRELNRRANLLADRLQKMGVGVGTLVAMCVERSLETIVAMLGILKAGGVYVPLDPGYPQERLVWMLEDTNAPVLLTQSHLIDRLPVERTQLIYMDANWGTDVELDALCPKINLDSSNLAYINYTSGSTGRPKGVVIPHCGVMRLVLGSNYTPLDRHQRILQLAPISFDAATFEIWGALLNGGCCVLFPDNGIPDPKNLGMAIKNYGITTLWLTASLFNTIVTEAPEALTGVKEILTGGEALSVTHIRRALELLPETQLVNGYGPTESTTFTCCYRIPRKLDPNLKSIPIGKPIANTKVYILDEELKPVSIGVPGELYIGGDGLAREYLNRRDLTEEKFIANPFSSEVEARLYKTGDLVRYLADGNIEFIGRKDNLVKIRGYRIELGEIETALSQHDSVRDAVTIVREDNPGDKRLVAYVTPKEEKEIAVGELKDYLKKRLPEYAIPAAILVLDKIPLTPNGKADRRSLPIPARYITELEAGFIAPSTPTEKKLADIWSGVLGLERVGIEDNFFDLGGTSLLGMQLVARIQKQFGNSFQAVKLYQYPTIRTLAQYFSQTESSDRSYQNMQSRAERQKAAQTNRQRSVRR